MFWLSPWLHWVQKIKYLLDMKYYCELKYRGAFHLSHGLPILAFNFLCYLLCPRLVGSYEKNLTEIRGACFFSTKCKSKCKHKHHEKLKQKKIRAIHYLWASLVAQMIKDLSSTRDWNSVWVWKIPWRRKWLSHSSILAWRIL